MEQFESSIFEQEEAQLMPASQGKRFANYLVDLIVVRITVYGSFYLLGMALPSVFANVDFDTPGAKLLDILITFAATGLVWGGMEALLKGKSIGKLITGTKTVNEDGSQISASTAFKRGLSRLVPFEPFSALGNPSRPWHDRWTNTYVIDEKQSFYPEHIIQDKNY